METVNITSKLLKDCYNKIKEIEDLEFINEEMAGCCAYYVKDEDYQSATWDDPGHDEIGHYEGWGEYAIGMVNAILQSIFDNCKDELKGIYKYEYFY